MATNQIPVQGWFRIPEEVGEFLNAFGGQFRQGGNKGGRAVEFPERTQVLERPEPGVFGLWRWQTPDGTILFYNEGQGDPAPHDTLWFEGRPYA